MVKVIVTSEGTTFDRDAAVPLFYNHSNDGPVQKAWFKTDTDELYHIDDCFEDTVYRINGQDFNYDEAGKVLLEMWNDLTEDHFYGAEQDDFNSWQSHLYTNAMICDDTYREIEVDL